MQDDALRSPQRPDVLQGGSVRRRRSRSKRLSMEYKRKSEKEFEAKRIKIYRNGDPFFAGCVMLVRGYRIQFSSFLDSVTKATRSLVPVHRLYDVESEQRITSVKDLEHGKTYVAARKRQKLYRMPYREISNNKGYNQRFRASLANVGELARVRTLMRRPSRAMLWAEKMKPTTINIIRNGEMEGAKLVLHPKDMLTFDQVFRTIEIKFPFPNDCITKIVTPSGEIVDDLGFIQESAVLITVGRKKKFKKKMYKDIAEELARRLPPVHRRGNSVSTDSTPAQRKSRQPKLTRSRVRQLPSMRHSLDITSSNSSMSPYSVLPPISPDSIDSACQAESHALKRVSFGKDQIMSQSPLWWDEEDEDVEDAVISEPVGVTEENFVDDPVLSDEEEEEEDLECETSWPSVDNESEKENSPALIRAILGGAVDINTRSNTDSSFEDDDDVHPVGVEVKVEEAREVVEEIRKERKEDRGIVSAEVSYAGDKDQCDNNVAEEEEDGEDEGDEESSSDDEEEEIIVLVKKKSGKMKTVKRKRSEIDPLKLKPQDKSLVVVGGRVIRCFIKNCTIHDHAW
eukprot:m.98289 g.98289  ORF g.98289 m.98289 type:complete len:570 (-) comp9005_c3_seq1:3633-5342(-)